MQLIDKRVGTSSGSGYDTTNYVLNVVTANGLAKRAYVPWKQFDQFSIADKIQKVKGETYPRKIV